MKIRTEKSRDSVSTLNTAARTAAKPAAKTITVVYWLSKTGQKKSLLAGGDGMKRQTFNAQITKPLLDLAEIDTDGNASIDFNKSYYTAFPELFDAPMSLSALFTWRKKWEASEYERLFSAGKKAENQVFPEQNESTVLPEQFVIVNSLTTNTGGIPGPFRVKIPKAEYTYDQHAGCCVLKRLVCK